MGGWGCVGGWRLWAAIERLLSTPQYICLGRGNIYGLDELDQFLSQLSECDEVTSEESYDCTMTRYTRHHRKTWHIEAMNDLHATASSRRE